MNYLKELLLFTFLLSNVYGKYKVCIPSTKTSLCQSLMKDDSQVECDTIQTRVDCALRLSRDQAQIGVFSEEELLLLSQQQPTDHRVLATIRDANRLEPYAYEAVAVVKSTHTNGLEGLRGGHYCHPGLDETGWSLRTLKTLEKLAAGTDRCPSNVQTQGKTAEELELKTLSEFFTSGCRPGPWSANSALDAKLKSQYPSLCQLCGNNCNGYSLDMGVAVSGVANTNRHIQALECLRQSGTVALAAWAHVREYFTIRNPQDMSTYSLLCSDGTLMALTSASITNTTAPCSLMKQPWSAIVASTSQASAVQAGLKTWWPNGANPGGNTWQSILFSALVDSPNGRVVFEENLMTPANYTSTIRTIPSIDSTTGCLPAHRWCTISAAEQTKCSWVRSAAYTLGVEPTISCQQRSNVIECLRDVHDDRADFFSSPSNYGYLARQHFKLSPVKLVQNPSASYTRVATLVKETSAQADINRFENLKGKKACFPEYGGIAYMSFVKTAQEIGVLSPTDCDYARAVGDFFEGACAPGAIDASHALSESSSYNATNLCSICKLNTTNAVTVSVDTTTCAWNSTNMYFGNKGSVRCLSDPNSHVAFVETSNIRANLAELSLREADYRVLCRNNTLAATTGVTVDDACLLAYVVDAEIIARRNDHLLASIDSLLDSLDLLFGYNAAPLTTQIIDLEIFSPFDNTADLLFKDSAIGLAEPSSNATHEPARNYIELFKHLEACTGSAPAIGLAHRNLYSIITLALLTLLSRYVIY